ANPTLKPKDKDGCAVRAILPRPERRGLSRTGSGSFTLAAPNATVPSTARKKAVYRAANQGL
ncbi:hypothetical protein, partial [Pigmentiphaga sp.]|uniref:hypothetical protein n=1 Tax=Pigmentiphaga sp. TaxID=1977564 RepID=UPI0025D4FA2D